MKKIITLLIIFLLLFVTGCNKNEDTYSTIKTESINFENIPLYDNLANSTYILYDSLEEYIADFNLDSHIIFKGIKINDSTQFVTTDNTTIYDWYSETPIQVIEPYYGDIKSGDEIIFNEFAAVIEINGDKFVVCDESTPPIKKNTEYIFFLCKSSKKSSKNTSMYSYISMKYSINEISQDIISSNTINEFSLKNNIDTSNLSEYGSFVKDVYENIITKKTN